MAEKLIVTGARGASATEVARRTGTFLGATVTPGMSDAEVMDAPISVINELVEAAGVTDQLAAVRSASSMDDGDITLSGEQTVGGVALVEGDRVLLTYQDAAAENGPWLVDAGAWTRPTDFDGAGEAPTGLLVQVSEGDNAGLWRLTTQGSNVIGTTGLTWRPFSLRSAAKVPFRAGGDALPETAQDALQRLGVYPQSFGATGLVSAADDTEAFNKATIAAQALGVPLIVPQGTYRVRMWTVLRVGGGLNIQVHPEAVIKLFGPLTGTDSVIEVYADNTRISGGIWDGGAPDATTTVGDNVVIKAFSGDASDPVLQNVVFNPTEVRNGNSHLVYVFGGKNCHVIGGSYRNAALNLIAFTAGNSAFDPEFDVPQEDCSIRNCFGDRTMNGTAAQQGGFKFYQTGAEATARETNRCTIQNCVAHMAEQVSDTSGNVVIEIWAVGEGSSLVNCRAVGGFIGLSIAKHQRAARIIGGYARRAGYLNIEAASVTKSGISGCVSECDDFTPIGIALDFQNLLAYPGYDLTCEDCIVDQPQLNGILIVGPDTSPANTWLAFGAVVSGCTVRMKSTRANATGIRAVRVSDINITGGFIDGALASGFNALTIERAQHVAIDGIKIRQIPNVAVQIIASGSGDTTDHVHIGNIFTDGTGVPIQFVTSGGTMGTNFSWGCYHGSSYLGVTNPGWTKLSPSGLDQSILSTGFCTGDPNGTVDAGRGSILLSDDGNTYQRLAASPADDWARLTGV